MNDRVITAEGAELPEKEELSRLTELIIGAAIMISAASALSAVQQF